MCQEPTPSQAANQPPVISGAQPLARETAQPRGEVHMAAESGYQELGLCLPTCLILTLPCSKQAAAMYSQAHQLCVML